MKKLMSAFLAAALLLVPVSPAYAASPDSEALEKAIAKVKSVIEIPNEASVFEYYSWDDPDNGKEWGLNWADTEGNESYSVMIDENGVISNFNAYRDEEGAGIGAVTKEQGQKNAENFMAKVLPDHIRDVRLGDSYSYDRQFSYSYDCYINGLPVNDMSVHIDVDKHTGDVVNYSGYNFTKKTDSFPAADDKIGIEKAKEALINDAGIMLIYNSYYDYTEKKLVIFPVFTNENKYVDAVTGEIVDGYIAVYATDASDAGGAGVPARSEAAAYELTPEEQNNVDNLAGLLSKEDAVKAAVSKVPGLTSSSELTSANLNARYDEKEKYIWNLGFEEYYVSIDARNGKLIGFDYYGETKNETSGTVSTVSKETAEKAALDFIGRVAPEEMKDSVFSERLSNTEIPAELILRRGYSGAEYSFTYVRIVNGIEFPSNNIRVAIDAASGKITQYGLNRNDNAEFPDVTGAMTAESAFDVFTGDAGFELMYIRAESDKMILAYGFSGNTAYSVDPFTGELLGYDGKPYKEYDIVEDYDDISGKWYENTVKTLLDNGYYIEGESFKGGERITQEEFLRYMYSPEQLYYAQEDFYEMLIREKIITQEEKSPDSILVRQDAAKFSIRYLGLEKAAKDGSIFISVYNDTVAREYMGYAAIAKSLRIIRGDANGSFNGVRDMTRAEAAVVIYNLLNNR